MQKTVQVEPADDALVKALFKRLYKAIGTEASAELIGCTRQNLEAIGNQAMPERQPSFRQVAILEAELGRPIVTEALANHVRGITASGDLLHETCDVVSAASKLLDLARRPGVSDRDRDHAIDDLERQVSDVTRLRAANE